MTASNGEIFSLVRILEAKEIKGERKNREGQNEIERKSEREKESD